MLFGCENGINRKPRRPIEEGNPDEKKYERSMKKQGKSISMPKINTIELPPMLLSIKTPR